MVYWKSKSLISIGEWKMKETYVCRDWKPRNEYTTPIVGKPDYRNVGIIKAVTADGEKIQVGKIAYESFFNEEYQYIISPFWNIIDGLDTDVFQGIPGIDMDLRLEHYYRVNYTPVFITERTPGKNREDLRELLESVGLDYYDRLEWLIRTDLRASGDNLIVERGRDIAIQKQVSSVQGVRDFLAEAQYGDEALLEYVILEFRKKNITLEMALEMTELSKSTFYRRMKMYADTLSTDSDNPKSETTSHTKTEAGCL